MKNDIIETIYSLCDMAERFFFLIICQDTFLECMNLNNFTNSIFTKYIKIANSLSKNNRIIKLVHENPIKIKNINIISYCDISLPNKKSDVIIDKDSREKNPFVDKENYYFKVNFTYRNFTK